LIGPSSYEGFLGQYFPSATAVPFKNWDEAVAAVFAGHVLAVYRDELEIQKINQSRKDASLSLKPVIYKDMKDPIAMAVAWNRPHLAAWLESIWTRSSPNNGCRHTSDLMTDQGKP